MEPVLELNDKGDGAFIIRENNEKLAEMVVNITGGNLTVFHTGVEEKAEGKGLAKALFTAMVAYVRAHDLKIFPLCVFVQAQLKRNPAQYMDIV